MGPGIRPIVLFHLVCFQADDQGIGQNNGASMRRETGKEERGSARFTKASADNRLKPWCLHQGLGGDSGRGKQELIRCSRGTRSVEGGRSSSYLRLGTAVSRKTRSFLDFLGARRGPVIAEVSGYGP